MQKYRITADNRRDVVKKLEEMLRERAIYTKMPRCAFIIRSIAIEKDGTVFIEDPEDLEIINSLQALGMIEPVIEIEEVNLEEDIMKEEKRSEGKTITVMLPIHPKKEIVPKEKFESHDYDPSAYDCLIEEPDPLITPVFTFPLSEYDPDAICNLVYTIYTRGELISKVTGGYFFASEELVENLQASYNIRVQDVIEAIDREGPGALSGMAIEEDKVVFNGFQATNDQELMDAWQALFDAINTTAINQRHVRPKRVKEPNEKYAFRNWLTMLGMNGSELKKTRWYLYHNLTGNTAFRTPEYAERMRRRRQEKEAKLRNNIIAGPQNLNKQTGQATAAIQSCSTDDEK